MDYTFNDQMVIPFDAMKEWTKNIFMGTGMNEFDATICADSLVTADARGVYSHGCMRTPIYCERIRRKGTSATGQPEVIRQRGGTVLMDGHNAMGQVVSYHGMKLAIEKAKEFGSSTVSITGSNHQGACAYFAMMAAKEDMIGISWTINGGNIMAPWGGTQPQLGNNPFAIAIPCLTKAPVVLDMAQSVVARGKIVMAMKTKTPIPITWALDVEGKPTTDPVAAYWGTVRPAGDYKGYGLTYINAILSGILNASSFGPTITDFYEEPEKVQNTGHFLQVIDISAISDTLEFKQRMDESINYLKNGKKAEGIEEIFVPGEIEANNLKRQLLDGITYPMEIIEENRVLSRNLNVEVLI